MTNATVTLPPVRPARKSLRLGLVLFAGLAVFGGVVASRAMAQEDGGPRAAFMRRMVTARLDAALDAAKVTDRQRQTVYAARDRVLETVAKARHGHADLDQALALFEQNDLDRDQLHALRQGREADLQRIGDAIEQALADVHNVLTPAQRKILAEQVRSHRMRH